MKYVKTLGLLAVAAAALMAFAASASATEITSSTGTTPTIHATAGELTFHTTVGTITCASSTLSGSVSSHGSGITANGSISSLSFSACGTNHVTVRTDGTGANGTGTLEAHTQITTVQHPNGGPLTSITHLFSNGNGTLTSNGTRVTIQITSLGISCIFETQNTKLGTITGGEHAVLDIESASIARVKGHNEIFCGGAGKLTGSYTVTHPTDLTIH